MSTERVGNIIGEFISNHGKYVFGMFVGIIMSAFWGGKMWNQIELSMAIVQTNSEAIRTLGDVVETYIQTSESDIGNLQESVDGHETRIINLENKAGSTAGITY